MASVPLAVILSANFVRAQDDSAPSSGDWEVVRPEPSAADARLRPYDGGPAAAGGVASAPSVDATPHGAFIACGEQATPASPEVTAIVARIDELWGAHVPVYQSVAPAPPHAAAGGCIFYNRGALLALLGDRLGVRDTQIDGPLLYAIFAHEAGHELHHELDPSRASVPNQVKELEADRFAGYTMQKLEIPASNLIPYWSMAGDEFGNGPAHGTSGQRVGAFKEGWNLAEWNRPEASGAVPGASDDGIVPDANSAAPDEPDGAPQ